MVMVAAAPAFAQAPQNVGITAIGMTTADVERDLGAGLDRLQATLGVS